MAALGWPSRTGRPVTPAVSGLTVVTSDGLAPRRGHLDVARAAIAGGAHAVQLRAKELDDAALLELAAALVAQCGPAGVPLIVNDRLDIALEVGADGVHLGQGDLVAEARQRLGAGTLGVSVGDEHEASTAAEAGADYLGVTVFATATKRDAEPVGLDGLERIATATELPVVAIGGITAATVRAVLEAGASGVAVVSAVGAAPDPVAATRALVALVADRDGSR